MQANNFILRIEIESQLSVQAPMFCKKMYISLTKVKTKMFSRSSLKSKANT
jgi:hypothetical protein